MMTTMRNEHHHPRLILTEENGCFYRRITPALVHEKADNMKYSAFAGMYLITESTDAFEEGSIVTEVMVYCELMRQHRMRKELDRL